VWIRRRLADEERYGSGLPDDFVDAGPIL